MKIEVYSEEQFKKELAFLQEETVYGFKVVSAEDTVSKTSGNPMTVVELLPLVENAKYTMKDYFVYIPIEQDRRSHFAQLKKVRDFLASMGMPYESDSMERIINKTGRFTVIHATNKDSGKKYWCPKDYISTNSAPVVTATVTSAYQHQYNNNPNNQPNNNLAPTNPALDHTRNRMPESVSLKDMEQMHPVDQIDDGIKW